MGYSHKLEQSVKCLNFKAANLETENEILREKHQKQASHNEKLFELNDKLSLALKECKKKMRQVHEQLKQPKECQNCNHLMTINNFNMSYDTMNMTFDAMSSF